MGITAIEVAGFKSIVDRVRAEIRPLTILAGANSSGKSSLLQPLLLMKQTLAAPTEPAGPLLLDGPNARFTRVDQFLSAERLVVAVEYDGDSRLELAFAPAGTGPEADLEIAELLAREPPSETTLRPGMTPDEIRAHVSGWPLTQFPVSVDPRLERSRWLLRVLWGAGGGITLYPGNTLVPRVQRLLHVPGLRGNPERDYATSAVGPVFPGTFDKYVASVVRHWQETGSPQLDALGAALERLGLTWKVEARALDATRVELRVGRLLHGRRGKGDLVSIADVGFGISQTLPVLVALLAAQPDQLVYLEQPELHLHPLAQHRLAAELVAAAKRGVRVVAETHSDILLTGIQTQVANGTIAPSLVKLHWFQRDAKSGSTRVTSADVAGDGSFGDWPQDFSEVTLRAQDEFLTASEDAARGETG